MPSYYDYFKGIQDYKAIEAIEYFNNSGRLKKKTEKREEVWREAMEIQKQIGNIDNLTNKEKKKLYERITKLRRLFFRYETEGFGGEMMELKEI